MIPRKNLVSISIIIVMVLSSFASMIPDTAVASSSKILYVGGSGFGNYTTIQSAIDKASNGDTVFVYSGTYLENINIHKEINLIGEDRNISIIDGGEIGDVINISSDNVTIKSLSIRNSNQTQHNSGIKIYNSTNSTITQCIISHNERGIEIQYSTNITIEGNIIDSNKERGVYLVFSDYNQILDNHITTEDIIPWEAITPGDTGIYLSYSNNNTISENTLSNTRYGIHIEDSSDNNHVTQNILTNHKSGLGILDSTRNNMSKNTVTNCKCGIGTTKATMNVLWGNTVQDTQRGICIYYWSQNNTISGNTLINNTGWGIKLYRESNNNLISCNTFISNRYGIYFEDKWTSNITVRDNCFIDDGIHVLYPNHNNIYNNTVNGKPLVYLENTSNISIDAGQVILIGCKNISITNLTLCNTCVGIELINTHNTTIKNNNISHNHNSGIYVRSGSSKNIIQGNIINANMHDGIELYRGQHNIISDNLIQSNKNNGICCEDSSNSIKGNRIVDNKNFGIYLSRGRYVVVTDNIISSNENHGIKISGLLRMCSIKDNIISFNNRSGIYLHYHYEPPSSYEPDYYPKHEHEISHNTIQSNKESGIDCYYSNSNKIIQNSISKNGIYGISFGEHTKYNSVYYNNFTNNYKHAYDIGDNLWDNGIKEGNYWDDFDEATEGAYDSNNDGIIDTPYDIPGGNSKDLYPLIKPFSQAQSHKGDSNNDGRIDVFDLDAFAQSWGAGSGHQKFRECFDFNIDGKIDVFDLDQFAQEWGKQYT